MSSRALIPEADLTRIFRAAKKAAYPVSIQIEAATGNVVIIPVMANDAPPNNPWDHDDDEE